MSGDGVTKKLSFFTFRPRRYFSYHLRGRFFSFCLDNLFFLSCASRERGEYEFWVIRFCLLLRNSFDFYFCIMYVLPFLYHAIREWRSKENRWWFSRCGAERELYATELCNLSVRDLCNFCLLDDFIAGCFPGLFSVWFPFNLFCHEHANSRCRADSRQQRNFMRLAL